MIKSTVFVKTCCIRQQTFLYRTLVYHWLTDETWRIAVKQLLSVILVIKLTLVACRFHTVKLLTLLFKDDKLVCCMESARCFVS